MSQEAAVDNEIYQEALKDCKCGCIYDKKTKQYHISNVVWVMNMDLLRQARMKYSSEEKDRILRQSLYHQLKDKKFETEHSHIKLEFSMQFEVENKLLSFSLCESCFVHFNQHKSKNKCYSLIILYHSQYSYVLSFMQRYVLFVSGKAK
jgi:hypothetical protein